MKKYTAIELKVILDNHLKWLRNEGGERANLSCADLSGADLSGADLRDANLSYANLSDTDLSGADLKGANLRYANLSYANLSDTDLSGANLSYDDLRNAYLSGANLSGANLSDTYLRGANLHGANLSGANLRGANLHGANLRSADLFGANLSSAYLTNIKMDTFQIVPKIGPFYVFKKLSHGIIATLYVPKSAGRVNGTTRKCRVSKAKIVALSNSKTIGFSQYDPDFKYELGKWIKPDSFNDDIRETCTNGIHCFITKQEAEEYS